MKKSIGIAIITRNEERILGQCLEKLKFADEIVVVDSESTDKTTQIAQSYGAKVYVRPWPGFGKQKKFAISCLSTDWVLILDADEILTDELIAEIKKASEQEVYQGFYLPIHQYFMGGVLHYGKAVSAPLRLFKKNCGEQDERNLNEKVTVEGKVGQLAGHAIHFSATTIAERWQKIRRDIACEILNPETRRFHCGYFLIDPWRYFFSYYFKVGSWRDGWRGAVLLALFTYQIGMQNFLIWKKQRAS